jgi:hypothetical protein
LRIRFSERELALLRGAEEVRGAALAHQPRPEVLRSALALAKAGHKLSASGPHGSISLEQPEVRLLIEALRFATQEVHTIANPSNQVAQSRRDAVLQAFPELADRGMWRSFGLTRELGALADRLGTALRAKT